MKLLYELPKAYELLIRGKCDQDEIKFCLPYDLSEGGSFAEGFLAVTEKKVFVLFEGELVKTVELSENMEFKAQELVASGMLTVTVDGETYRLCSYSMEYLARYAYVARALCDLCGRGRTLVESNDIGEHKCPKCGRLFVHGTKFCPHCADKLGIMKRVAGLAKKEYKLYLLVALMFIANAAIALWNPAINKNLINNVLDPATRLAPSLSLLLTYVGLMAFASALAVAVSICRNILMALVGTRLTRDLKSMVYDKIQSLSISYLDSKKTGDLMNRINNDTQRINDFFQNVLAQGFNEVLVLVGAVVVLFCYNWKMGLIVVLPSPAIVVLFLKTHDMMNKRYHIQWRKLDKLNSFLNDILRGIRVVKAFGQEDRAVETFQHDAAVVRDVTTKNEKLWCTFGPATQFIIGFGGYLLILYSGNLVLNLQLTIGEMVQFSTYAGYFYQRLDWLCFMPRWINDAVTSSQRIFEVMDEEPDILERSLARAEDVAGDVKIENVTFGYKSYHAVLKDVSVTVKEGEMIGLVGHSGAGKSTLINLIMRLYDPDEGRITIGGTDIRDFSTADYKSQIGVVLQETFLFSGTIAQNIAYSRPGASRDDIIRAAKIANAHDFICKFPDGYDTRTGEKGQRLSGGERQRIAIARAVLADPRILILDEATASVDTETEEQIQQALSRVIKGRTTFAIAHRLSTLKNADRILVLDKGEVAEIGTHNELLEKKGIYYNLVEAQKKMSAIKAIG